MASEIGSLSKTNRELRTEEESLKAQLVLETESARKMNEEWKEVENVGKRKIQYQIFCEGKRT